MIFLFFTYPDLIIPGHKGFSLIVYVTIITVVKRMINDNSVIVSGIIDQIFQQIPRKIVT